MNKLIEGDNLSKVWQEAFLLTASCGEVSPLVVTVKNFNGMPLEQSSIKEALDSSLRNTGDFETKTTANLIFPNCLWNRDESRSLLFSRYKNILDRLQKMERKNCYGIYFQRLIDYGSESLNQLEKIIEFIKSGNSRSSGLQAAIFDPLKDLRNQRVRGFPCLQQVGFNVIGKKQLAIYGFYPKQYLYSRAYGNYLGLCRLGNFMAHELGFEFVQMSCFVGVAELGVVKSSVATLISALS